MRLTEKAFNHRFTKRKKASNENPDLNWKLVDLNTAALAEEKDQGFYDYGSICEAGSTLCSLVNDGKIDEDYATKFLTDIVTIFTNDQELDAVFPYIENAYEGISKEKQCEGIYD